MLLTDEGMILRKRAEEILTLVQKAKKRGTDDGCLYCGRRLHRRGRDGYHPVFCPRGKAHEKSCPDIRYHISSGNAQFVTEQLDKGLIDFGLMYGPVDRTKYEALTLPIGDRFGVLMRRDDSLAQKEWISPEELRDKPLILSAQDRSEGWTVSSQIRQDVSHLNVAATYNLIFNASLMVEEGLGYAFAWTSSSIQAETASCAFFPCARKLSSPLHRMETLSGVLQGIGTVPSGTDFRHGFAAKMIRTVQAGGDHPGDGMRAFCK